MATSQNGYTANVPLLQKRYLVPGTQVGLTLRRGPVATVLLYVASQFDARVEDIDNARGGLDDWGYAERPIRGTATVLSNHASGTAMDLNATTHPLGVKGTYSAAQATEIRKILAEVGDVVRCGEFYAGRVDPMHFEIDANIARVTAVAARLTVRPPQEAVMALSDKDVDRVATATAAKILAGSYVGRDDNRRTIAQAIGGTQDLLRGVLETLKGKP